MKALIIFTLILLSLRGNAQGFIRATEMYQNLYEIKDHLEPYFIEQREAIGDEKFYHEGSEYNTYIKYVNFWEPILFPHGEFNIFFNGEQNAWSSNVITGIENRSDGDFIDWHELGPNKIQESNTIGIGPIEFTTINPNNHSEMLAGSLKGGLFYSSDGAESWSNHGSDDWENSGCTHAVFHPYLSNVVYATSNRGGQNSDPSINGSQGKIKRLVGGNWETIADYTNFNNDFYTKYYKLLIDPLYSGTSLRLFIATSKGLYMTTQGNDPMPISWYKFTSPLLSGKIYDIEFVPNQTGSQSNRIIASVFSSTSNTWNVVYSINGGASWQVLPSHPVMNNPDAFLTIEVSEANSDVLYVYYGDDQRTLYRYQWSNNLWTQVGTSTGDNFGSCHAFGVSPINENYIAINQSLNMKVTTDGGQTWAYRYTGHSDVEDITWHPSELNSVLVSNHGGVYKSINTAESFVPKYNGLGVGEVTGLATSYTDPGRIAVGLFHDNSVVSLNNYTQNFIPEWHRRFAGDGLRPLIDYTDENKVWLTHQYGNSSFQFFNDIHSNSGLSIYDNVFRATKWTQRAVLNTEDPSVIYFNYHYSGNSNIDIARAEGYGLASKESISNFGNNNLGMTDYRVALITTDPNDPDILYAQVIDKTTGVEVMRLFRTLIANNSSNTDVEGSWVELQIPLDNKYVSDIEVSFQNSNVLYFSYNTKYESSTSSTGINMCFKVDYSNTLNCILGSNCINLTSNLPTAYSGSSNMALEKGTNEGIYFATNFGVYFSNSELITQGQDYWILIGDNLPNVVPSGIEINYEINKVRVSYAGRGVWEHALHCPSEYQANESVIYVNDKFVEVQDYIVSNAQVNNGIDVDYRAGDNIELIPGFSAKYGADFSAFIHGCSAPGNSFKSANYNPEYENITLNQDQSKINQKSVKIYPNPTTGKGQVVIEEFDHDSKCQILIYNSIGIEIFRDVIARKKYEFDISDQENGIYFIQINCYGESIVKKVIKTN